MARRLIVLSLLLVVGLFAVWVLRSRRLENGPGRVEAADRAPASARSAAAPELVPAVSPHVQQRESAPLAPSSEPPGEVAKKVADPAGEEALATLVVRVLDKANGAPLAGVRVHVRPRTPGSFRWTPVDGTSGTLGTAPITAAEGRVEIEVPAGVDLQLWAQGMRGIAGRANRDVETLAVDERRELTVEIPTGDDLHYFGRILAKDDERPIAGATVELVRGEKWTTSSGDEPDEKHFAETRLAETVTSSDGLFELRLPSWKEPDLRIRAPGFGQVLLQVGDGYDTPESARVVLLARSASLHARLVDAGGGSVVGDVVRLWTEAYELGEPDHGAVYLPSVDEAEWSVDADATGLCVLGDLPPDVPFHVEILRGGRVVKKDLDSISLSPGEVREVEWTIGSGCRLEGIVVDQHGAGVEGRAIWLQRADQDVPRFFQKYHSGEVILQATTDSDARFAFADVGPGKWWIGPGADRDDWEGPDPDGIAPLARVVEVPEGLSRLEIDLLVHRALFIRGRVLSPADAPAPDTYIFASSAVASWMISARTDRKARSRSGRSFPGAIRSSRTASRTQTPSAWKRMVETRTSSCA